MAESLLDRFGVLGVLTMAQVAYVCRMLWYASLTPATVMYVQLRLRALGFDPGPVDGIAGPRTRAAVASFQTAESLTVDGELSRELVEDLFERDTPRRA